MKHLKDNSVSEIDWDIFNNGFSLIKIYLNNTTDIVQNQDEFLHSARFDQLPN